MRHFSVYSVLSWRNDAKNDSGCIISELHKTDKMSSNNNKGNIFLKKSEWIVLLPSPFCSIPFVFASRFHLSDLLAFPSLRFIHRWFVLACCHFVLATSFINSFDIAAVVDSSQGSFRIRSISNKLLRFLLGSGVSKYR